MAEWYQLSGQIGLDPDFIAKIKPPIDAVFQTINLTLDLLQEILNFVKSFLIDFTQPIKIIIDALVAQLKALILDIKQLGVYLTSDLDLIDTIKTRGLEAFSKGYAGFENRMVEKLTNPNDSTRPIFSTASTSLSIFIVASANLDGIVSAINLIAQVIEFFTGKSSPTALPNPVNITSTIKNGFFPVNISKVEEYDGIKINWEIAPPPNSKGTFFPSFINPPKSFLIHVRTRPEAWYLGYKVRPNNKTTPTDKPINSVFYLNTEPARVYGGVDYYDIQYQDVYFLEDPNSEIEYKKEDILKTGKTFYYSPSTVGSFLGGSSYSLYIDKNDLPISYEYSYVVDKNTEKKKVDNKTLVDTSSYYIDIVSCDADLGLNNGAVVEKKIALTEPNSLNQKVPETIKVTRVFETASVVVPLPETKDYLYALRNALTIYFVGNYYLDTPNTGMGLSQKTQDNIRAYLRKEPNNNSLIPNKDYRDKIDSTISIILNKMDMPDQSIIQSLQKDIQNLAEPYLKDPSDPFIEEKITIYDLIDRELTEQNFIPGIAYDKTEYQKYFTPGQSFNQKLPENTPILYSATTKIVDPLDLLNAQGGKITKGESLREYFEKTKGTQNILLKDSARKFLDYLPRRKVPSGVGSWVNYRFFEDGIPEFEEFLKIIINFLESLSFGLDGIIKAIRDYIDLIILRIEELQVLINRIKAIIDKLLNFKIGANFAVLFSENQGTRGIVENLINSTNKPPYLDTESFAFGTCLVLGGYPSFIPALLKALAGG